MFKSGKKLLKSGQVKAETHTKAMYLIERGF